MKLQDTKKFERKAEENPNDARPRALPHDYIDDRIQRVLFRQVRQSANKPHRNIRREESETSVFCHLEQQISRSLICSKATQAGHKNTAELTRSQNSLSDVFEMRERAVDISLDLLRHGVRAFQVLSEVLQAVSIQSQKLRPGLQAHFVRLPKSFGEFSFMLTFFVFSISTFSW